MLPFYLLTFRTAFTDALVRTMCWWPVKTVSRSVTLDCWTWWRTNRASMPPERKMGKVAKLTYLYFQIGPFWSTWFSSNRHQIKYDICIASGNLTHSQWLYSQCLLQHFYRVSCLILPTVEFVYVPVRFSYCWFSPLSLQSHSFDKKSDVWAFGVTVWEMFVMKKPFHCNLEDRVLTRDEVNIFLVIATIMD